MVKSSLEKVGRDLEEDWLGKKREKRKTAGVKGKGASMQGRKKTLKQSPLCPQGGLCNRRVGPWLGGRGAQFIREKINRFFFSLLNCRLSPCESRKVIEQEWVIILFRSLSIQHKSVFALGERAGSYLQGWMKLHSWLWVLLVILSPCNCPGFPSVGAQQRLGVVYPGKRRREPSCGKCSPIWQILKPCMCLECDFGWVLPNFNSYHWVDWITEQEELFLWIFIIQESIIFPFYLKNWNLQCRAFKRPIE